MAPDGSATSDEIARNAVVTETIKVVSSSLLGLTVGCAECHDHRYDPIAQRDFYKLRAILEPGFGQGKTFRPPKSRAISLLNEAETAEANKIEAEARQIEAELQPKLVSLRDEIFEKELAAVPEEIRAPGRAAWEVFIKDPKKLTPEQTKLLDDYPRLKVVASSGILNLFLTKYNRQEELTKFQDDLAKRAAAVRARKPKADFIRAFTELPVAPPETHLFKRGDYTQPGAVIAPGALFVLGGKEFPLKNPALPTSGRRLAFAQYLTNGQHPLVPRVLVNRFWMEHFGRGLVGTPGDFGKQGERPTHPELLDWLAADFVKTGWDLKKFHRQVMISSVYRQSSRPDAKASAIDAGNELLSHMPVRRLEAETIRDTILAITGKLNPKQFGEPVPVSVDENQQVVVGTGKASADGSEFRRSIYVQQRRSQPAYLLNVFDEPNMEPNCDIRTASTVAPQSLLLMNSQFIQEQANFFAARVRLEAGEDPCAEILHAWQLAYGGSPREAELLDMLAYLKKQTETLAARAKEKKDTKTDTRAEALASFCQVLLASNRLLYVD
jgi:hypothetical protein